MNDLKTKLQHYGMTELSKYADLYCNKCGKVLFEYERSKYKNYCGDCYYGKLENTILKVD